MDPANNRSDAQLRALTEVGHRRRFAGRDRDLAICGREAVKAPEVNETTITSSTSTSRVVIMSILDDCSGRLRC